ncbi:MAG: hypothetical protein KDD42_10185, partial [Bdellovibrionales bacterium]|nr:hypothetical protein [Bdellovibrionales bacterium]
EAPTAIPNIRKAENLLRQSLGMHDPLFSKLGTVELLRASSLLHKGLEGEELSKSDRAKSLYLLGLSYAKLPSYFINELPEFFLEQCIRENPGTTEAKKAYKLYKDVVTLGFTGSSGTHLPPDIQLKLRDLHDMAYENLTVSLGD